MNTKSYKQYISIPSRKTMGLFLIFLLVSVILWLVMALNEPVQRDLRCKIEITNVPDSITRISPIPEYININVTARGLDLVKYSIQSNATLTIDYKKYATHEAISIEPDVLKTIIQNSIGKSAHILSFTPDSLNLLFTSRKGVRMPVIINTDISTAPQYALVGQPKIDTDSVMIYSTAPLPKSFNSVQTSLIQLDNLTKSYTKKVPVDVPRGYRAIPDSVEVTIEVEQLLYQSSLIPIKTVNVPSGIKLSTTPSVKVNYMLPMSLYKKMGNSTGITLTVDYNDIDSTSTKLPIKVKAESPSLKNIYLETDSVDYFVQK